MKATGFLMTAASVALLAGCGATVPIELTSARQAYTRASEGPAARSAPVELHAAQTALTAAEASYKDDADSYRARDLAYVAQRKAEMAEAQASINTDQASSSQSRSVYRLEQGAQLQERTQDLNEARTQLAVSEQARQSSAEQLVVEQEARLDAEQRLTERNNQFPAPAPAENRNRDAMLVYGQSTGQALSAELAKPVPSRMTARGEVFTLSGDDIFLSNEAALVPGAEWQLDQLVKALASAPDRMILVDGFTDSQGSAEHNLDLSQRRADAVRGYLMRSGCDADQVQARGIGAGSPVADNATSEGRANNRRIEIVLVNAQRQ